MRRCMAAIMTNDVITANPDTTVDEVAKILLKMKISGLPEVSCRELLTVRGRVGWIWQ